MALKETNLQRSRRLAKEKKSKLYIPTVEELHKFNSPDTIHYPKYDNSMNKSNFSFKTFGFLITALLVVFIVI